MISPFKFLDSYTKDDRDIFFGREREIEELYHRVFESRIMLVYGVSGTGKSSLIHCGLANKFQDTDWLPIVIRRGGNIIESMAAGIRGASLTEQQSRLVSPSDFKKGVRSLYLDHYKPVFFIFDQFEELFIFGDKEERKSFVQIVKSLFESELQCRLIFVMREEYMAGVTEFEKYIPAFFANRVRIEKMSHVKALEAIKGPCNFANISLEEGFAEALLEKLSPGETDVELTYLQVFLDRLFRLAQTEKHSGTEGISFNLSLFQKTGDVSDLLGSFLEEQLKDLNEPDTGLTILKSFVSLKGTKRQLTEEEVIAVSRSYGKDIPAEKVTDLLQKFVNLRILRDKDENEKFELRHDSLATKIYEKITIVEKEMMEIYQFLENALLSWQKRKLLLSVNDLKYLAPYEDRLFVSRDIKNLIDQSKKEQDKIKRRIKRIAVSGFIAILIFSFGSIGMVKHWPLNYQIRIIGFLIYAVWFLPVFGFYVIKTKDNRVMNLIFLLFTLIFIGNLYLFTKSIRNKSKNLIVTPSIQNEQKAKERIEIYNSKSDSIYAIIKRLYNLHPDKIKFYNPLVDSIEQRTEELVSFIQDIKIEIIVASHQDSTEAINGREIDISKIPHYDEDNVPSAILIGSENNGKAFYLSKLISEYKDFLSVKVQYDKVMVNTINRSLNLNGQKNYNANTQSWETTEWEWYTFHLKPLNSVINELSQIQADIKYCESESMAYLYNKINSEPDYAR